MNGALASLVHEGFLLLATTGGPLVGSLMLVGVILGMFQAATQINDPALGFLPRMAVALLGAWALGGWVLERFAGYFASAVNRMSNLQ